jgi:hypothetical protein
VERAEVFGWSWSQMNLINVHECLVGAGDKWAGIFGLTWSGIFGWSWSQMGWNSILELMGWNIWTELDVKWAGVFELNYCEISGWSWSQMGWNISMEMESNGMEYYD